MAEAHVGTSGWSYPHWRRTFYPAGVPDARRLAYYAERLATVEINSTFYAPPRPAFLHRWAAAVPPGFLFAVKGSRRFTHDQRLQADHAEVLGFFAAISELGDKLGPILFQTPPGLACDPTRLAEFLSFLPPGFRVAFEFRDPSWWNAGIYALLAEKNAAFCLFDLNRKQSPVEVTADFVYIRLHGPGRPYHDRYPAATLDAWEERIAAWCAAGKEVFLYFDNTEKAAAAHDAQEMRARLGGTATRAAAPFHLDAG